MDRESYQEKLYIAISGMIGVGKTTLSTELGKIMGLSVYYEPVVDQAYLSDFYTDPKRFSFPLQISLLNGRFEQQQRIIWSGQGGIQDRTIYEDGVFAKMLMESGHMDERDYETYVQLFNNMSNFMKRPNLIVHLDIHPEESLRRIRQRDRPCEREITLDYLRHLHRGYDKFLQEISISIPVLRVKWDPFQSPEEVARRILKEWIEMRNIRCIDFKASL